MEATSPLPTPSLGRLGAPEYESGTASTPPRPRTIPAYDVRLPRELAYRRLVISVVRRVLRVVSLHLLDAALLAGVVSALVAQWPTGAALRPLAPAVVGLMLLCLNAMSAYRPGDARRDRRRLFAGVLLAVLVLACFSVLPPHLPFDALSLILLGGAGFVVLAIGRFLTDQAMREVYRHGIGLRRALLVGAPHQVEQVVLGLGRRRVPEQHIIGHLSTAPEPEPTALGGLGDLEGALDRYDVQEVLVAGALPTEALHGIAQRCFERGTELYLAPSDAVRTGYRTEPLRIGGYPLFRLHPEHFQLPGLAIKRTVDVVLALLFGVLALPLVALIAIAIKLDSPGPVFFRQERVGLGGRRFTMWKFRSMYADAPRTRARLEHLNSYDDPRLFKLPADPRITRVGRLLRRCSLDELPQLLNVLLGDMSLVGPRPPLPSEVSRYEPHHYERLSVVPGMTGPWQVGGRNLITDFETVVQMEREYIRSWSLLLDTKILLRTVGVVIRGEGAY